MQCTSASWEATASLGARRKFRGHLKGAEGGVPDQSIDAIHERRRELANCPCSIPPLSEWQVSTNPNFWPAGEVIGAHFPSAVAPNLATALVLVDLCGRGFSVNCSALLQVEGGGYRCWRVEGCWSRIRPAGIRCG